MHGRTGILGRTLGSLDEHALASKLRKTRQSPSILDGVPTYAIDSAEVDDLFREGYVAKLAGLAKNIPDHLDRQAKLDNWNEARGVIRGVEKGCIPLKEHLGPEYRAFFERFEDTGSWGGDGGRKTCRAVPTTPWKVRAPQARGCSLFEVLCEYAKNKKQLSNIALDRNWNIPMLIVLPG